MDLQLPVQKFSRSYKMYFRKLERLGIHKLEDFLFHIPFRYDDYSLTSNVSALQEGETVTVMGNLESIKNVYTYHRKNLQQAVIADNTGKLNVLWFNQPFLTRILKPGDHVSLSGKIVTDKGKLAMISPEYEVIFGGKNIHTGRLVPVYPETHGISSKWLRRQIYKLLDQAYQIKEYLPPQVIDDNNLMDLSDALRFVHFPNSLKEADRAKQRLAFDELFDMQLQSLVRKKLWQQKIIKKPMEIERGKIEGFIKSLPFELTNSQVSAVGEIIKDLSLEKPMNRLLEGDVGSGKTVVACIAMYIAFMNNLQSAFLAPTEILAKQHFKTIKDFLSPFGLQIKLFTGSSKKNQTAKFDIAVGTHALIYNRIEFEHLGLVVIDEQQRFGVEQRASIRGKGNNPHLLTMTATPIPRTVALTMYGDLDLSLLSDMPKGRKIVKTWLVPPIKRNGAYAWIEKKIKTEFDQVFIVCPFIEESESMVTVKAAKMEYERLKNEIFPDLKLGLLHGKLKADEKDRVLTEFKDRKIDILVSTPVVEVGIDIPGASIMLIEEAERFGLAQLHQLRGRVGRSDKQAYCLLFTQSKTKETLDRLKLLETVYSGAQLAEFDLKLRGPGQIHGTAQHGIPRLKIASFADFDLIEKTGIEARKIFHQLKQYPMLSARIKPLSEQLVSPD